jgi:arginine-tRNA-protein transferase
VTEVNLWAGQSEACAYLEGRKARMAFLDPSLPVDAGFFGVLLAHGFRRSGDLLYRTHCPDCTSCVPVRIPVAAFRPNRSQRRVLSRLGTIRVIERPSEFDPRHFDLYQRYLNHRHAESGMASTGPEDYQNFLLNRRFEGTVFFEFWQAEMLLAVSVVDVVPRGFSAVYTFFEPAAPRWSLGTLAILFQIEEARRRGLTWVYLGFWIRESNKMNYKAQFRPLECLTETGWRSLDRQK